MPEILDPIRTKALELAVSTGGDFVARAREFHMFLQGGDLAAAAAAQAVADKTADKTAKAAADKAAKAAADKAAKATADKAAAAKTTTAKTTTAAAGKPAGATAPTGSTKDPNGNNTYDDVVAALQKVMRSVPNDNEKRDAGRKLAYDILAATGGGVKGVRDLKPTLYDAVVAGCEKALKPKAVPAAAPAEAEEDPLGDPVEETGGGVPAEGEDL